MAQSVVTSGSKAFQVEGLDELKTAVAGILDRASAENLKDVSMQGAQLLLQEFRATAPVGKPPDDKHPGSFRDSAFLSKGDPLKPDVLFIIDTKKAPHAHFVEYGTSKMAPMHPIRSAVNSTRSSITGLIADGFRKLLGIESEQS